MGSRGWLFSWLHGHHDLSFYVLDLRESKCRPTRPSPTRSHTHTRARARLSAPMLHLLSTYIRSSHNLAPSPLRSGQRLRADIGHELLLLCLLKILHPIPDLTPTTMTQPPDTLFSAPQLIPGLSSSITAFGLTNRPSQAPP